MRDSQGRFRSAPPSDTPPLALDDGHVAVQRDQAGRRPLKQGYCRGSGGCHSFVCGVFFVLCSEDTGSQVSAVAAHLSLMACQLLPGAGPLFLLHLQSGTKTILGFLIAVSKVTPCPGESRGLVLGSGTFPRGHFLVETFALAVFFPPYGALSVGPRVRPTEGCFCLRTVGSKTNCYMSSKLVAHR